MGNKSIVRSSLIYLCSNIFNRAIPFLLLPVFTSYLSPEEYGTLALFQVLTALLTPVVGLSLSTHITRNIHKLSLSDMSGLFSKVTLLLIKSTALVIFVVILLILVNSNLNLYSIPFSDQWLLLAPAIAALITINLVNLTIYRNINKPKIYAASEFARTVVNAVCALVILIGFGSGWYSIVIGQVVALMFTISCSVRLLHSYGYIRFDRPPKNRFEVGGVLAISFPLIPHALSSVAILMLDRFVVEYFLGVKSVGIYSLGHQVGMISAVLIDALILAWSPWFYKKITDEMNYEEIISSTYKVALIFLFFVVSVSIVGPWLIKWFVAEEYYSAVYIVTPIAVANLFYGFYKMLFPYLVSAGKTGFLAFSTSLAAMLNFFLNVLLVPVCGMEGAAYATIAAYFVSFLLVFYKANHLYPMPWLLRK